MKYQTIHRSIFLAVNLLIHLTTFTKINILTGHRVIQLLANGYPPLLAEKLQIKVKVTKWRLNHQLKCIYIHSSTLNNIASFLSQVYQQSVMRGQSELAVKNVAREKRRDESIVHTDANLHWTTANVHLYVDSCLDLPHCMVL